MAITGSIFITISTLGAFLIHGLHGDMVAQQVIVMQWADGAPMLAATMEATNYIIKFPLYFLANATIDEPVMRLIVVTFILNVTAWLLIWLFIFKIVQLMGSVSRLTILFIGIVMLFLASISQSIFWINYANSRNIELAFMLGVLYFLLVLVGNRHHISAWIKVMLGMVAGLFFVNDPLGLYLVVVPFVAIVGVWALVKCRLDIRGYKRFWSLAVFIVVSLLSYFVLKSYILGYFLKVPDKVSAISAPQGEGAVYSIINIVNGLAFNAGIIPPNQLGESRTAFLFTIFSLLFTILIIGLITLSLVMKKTYTRRLQLLLLGISLLALLVVYISGYLAPYVDLLFARYVVIVNIILLTVSAIGFANLKKKHQLYIVLIAFVLVAAMSVLFIKIQITNAPRFTNASHYWHTKNERVYKLIEIAKEYKINKGYSSLQTAQPTTYLTEGGLTMVPVMCDKSNPRLPIQRAYEWLIEASSAYVSTGNTMIEVASKPSDFNPCSKDVVLSQIKKTPLAVIQSGKNHTVIVYDDDIREQLYGVPRSFYDKK